MRSLGLSSASAHRRHSTKTAASTSAPAVAASAATPPVRGTRQGRLTAAATATAAAPGSKDSKRPSSSTWRTSSRFPPQALVLARHGGGGISNSRSNGRSDRDSSSSSSSSHLDASTTTTTTPTTVPTTVPTTTPAPGASCEPPPSQHHARRRQQHQQHQQQQQHHHHHAPSAPAKPRPFSVSVFNMPAAERPRQPQLSAAAAAAAARATNRSPLTPKIAAKASPATPLARRPHSSTPVLAGTAIPRDGASSPPVNSFLSNITPRSGPRQSRVDSATCTPSRTPKPDELENNTTISNSNSRAGPERDSAAASNDSSKFFYASDAKMAQPAPLPRPVSVPPKAGNAFIYANGATVGGGGARKISPPSHSVSLSTTGTGTGTDSNADNAPAKFFFANGARDTSLSPNLPPHASSASTAPSSSKLAAARPLSNSFLSGPGVPAQRPASPIKSPSTPFMAQTLPPTSPKRSSMASPTPALKRQASSSAASPTRKVSIDATPREMGGHRRTGSGVPMDPAALSRLTLSRNVSEAAPHSPPLSPGLSKTGMTMASILQAPEDVWDHDQPGDQDLQPDAQGAAKSTTQARDPVSELVANARRERKVQDLEITNGSLEAINRTLERQLRKQTAELRRYRRLSRSGALSAASSRVTSLALAEPAAATDVSHVADNVGETDRTEHGQEDEDYTDSLHESSDESSGMSLNTEDLVLPGAKMEARRRRDEKRLQLDLTKHQELLIDSQKMNQSLKRCLDFTEALIKEGQKALEYRVRVSDVRLGGRILAPPDEDDDDVSFVEEEAAVAPHVPAEEVDADAGLEPPWSKSGPDRDSGIELRPGEGS